MTLIQNINFSDSGISSAISEEEADTVDLLHEKRKLVSASLKAESNMSFFVKVV